MRKTSVIFGIVVMMFSFLQLESAEAQRRSDGRSRFCAVLYEHEDFRGSRLVMRNGESISNFKALIPNFNDFISSVEVNRGCSVTLYQHIRFGGFSRTYDYSTAWVGNRENDEFSSAECYCRR